ncbi:transporter [Novosphingobium aquiterrae]|uniref:Transporter n=1 Tax=Novosphingobium aquiterrae TaxID=624388 RepID=A0ABV6PFA7_9SPHN
MKKALPHLRTLSLTVRLIGGLFLALGLPGIAEADDREFCADRPGLGTSSCTLAPGDVMIELGIAGWDHSSDAAAVSDEWNAGEVLVRIGVGERTEVQIGHDGFSASRVRNRATGSNSRESGLGDVIVAMQRGLSGANGSVAAQVFLTLPTGRSGIGAGTWSVGAKLPATLPLSNDFELGLTPEIAAAANASGSGRHLAWGGVVGLGRSLGRSLSAEIELAGWRNLDPAGHFTTAQAAFSLAWQPARDWQLDAEIDLGLTAATPGRAISLGLARRF